MHRSRPIRTRHVVVVILIFLGIVYFLTVYGGQTFRLEHASRDIRNKTLGVRIQTEKAAYFKKLIRQVPRDLGGEPSGPDRSSRLHDAGGGSHRLAVHVGQERPREGHRRQGTSSRRETSQRPLGWD